MIEIDAENKKIFFYFLKEDLKKNDKRDDEMHEFDLLSCHKCPKCGKIIDAYYVGTLPIGDSSNEFYCHPYLPSNASYNRYDPHYKYGHEYGGGYLILFNHNDTCKLRIAPTGGVINGIKYFIDKDIEVSDIQLKKIAGDIFENKLPGVFLIEDVCKQREPMLAVEHEVKFSLINEAV